MSDQRKTFSRRAFGFGRSRLNLPTLYRGIDTRIKVVGIISLLVFAALVFIQTIPEHAIPAIGFSAALVAIAHLTLTRPDTSKVGIVLVMALVSIVSIAGIATELTPPADQSWVFLVWVTTLLIGYVFYTLLCYRYTNGKVWVTLGLIVVTITACGFLLPPLLYSSESGMTVLPLVLVLASGALPLLLRSFNRRAKAVLPVDDAVHFAQIKTKEPHGLIIKPSQVGKHIVGTDTKGRMFIMSEALIDQPLAIHPKRGITYHGFPLGGWVADQFFQAQAIAPRKTPFTHVICISGDPALDKNYRVVKLSSREGNSEFVVFLVGSQAPFKQVVQILQSENQDPATLDQIKKTAANTMPKKSAKTKKARR